MTLLSGTLPTTFSHFRNTFRATTRILILSATVHVLCTLSFAQGNVPARPAYQILRLNEDWSVLAKPGGVKGADYFDPVKYVPLKKNGSIWMSFGGQVRERVESWQQFNFGAPVTAVHNDSFLFSRLMLHADLHLGPSFRIFVEGKSALATHRALIGGVRAYVDKLDFANAFVDVKLPLSDTSRLTLRAGRQELSFGRERFVGVSDWSNTRRTWDGFSGILAIGKSDVTFFWARPVRIVKYYFNPSDHATQLYGLHFNHKLPPAWGTMETYWYGLDNRLATYNGTTGREIRHTFGGHNVNQIGKSGFDYDLGGSIQLGSVGAHSIRAHGLVTQLGYTLRKTWSTPRVYLGYDYASGSRQPGGDVGTFNLLFPTAHGTLGYADIVGRQNMFDFNTGVALNPAPKWKVRFDGYSFWRASANDALYDKRGAVVRPGFPGSARKTGAEVDSTVRYQFDAHTIIQLGYSHFFPGPFLKQSGPHEPVDFVYLSLQFTF